MTNTTAGRVFQFDLIATDPHSGARRGRLHTDHGTIETPAFMPVGTRAAVKALTTSQVESLGPEIILGNTYHLYLKPGNEIMESVGGLHRFMDWNRALLTDSGGFQVFSLEDLRSVTEEGVEFKSHIDGSKHLFTPENVVETQRVIGSDIAMVLDECPPATGDRSYQAESMRRSMRWAARARKRHLALGQPLPYGHHQAQFGIVQGGVEPDLRRESAERLMEIGFEGYAIGGLAVGETREKTYEIAELTASVLPADQPRYLMGVGTPEDLLEAVARGVDMFDCVMPTRNARNGTLFTKNGKLNIRNATYASDSRPIEDDCTCQACTRYSRAYIRHLFNVDEITGLTLATLHNLHFYLELMRGIRERIG